MDKLATFIFDFVIAVIIVFIATLIYFGLRTETVIKTMDNEITEDFLSKIKETGTLTTDDYENFLHQLSITDVLYDISFEHKYKLTEPEYRMRTIEEIIAAQKAAYTGENIYHYREVVTERPNVTDPINNSGLTMNTETNESVLAGAVNTPATGHIHNDSCYIGHKHSGSQSFTHIHAHDTNCQRYLSKVSWNVRCNDCGKSYQWTSTRYYWDPINGQTLSSINILPLQKCIQCTSTNLAIGTAINDYSYSCNYNIDENADELNDGIPNGINKTYQGMSTPQDIKSRTYTTGCYTYHRTRPYTELFTYSFGSVTNMNQAVTSFLQDNVEKDFCTLPEYITCGYTENGGNAFNYICYRGVLQPDGTLLFYFSSYSDYITCYYGTTTNPGFPSGITKNQLRDFFYYDYMSTFDRVIGHSYTYSAGKITRSIYETINCCTFDHALGINQWLTTCGQVENATIACNQRVVSITPTHPVQSVYTGEALITTVKATYQDGSSKVVLSNFSFNTNNPILNKVITLSYTDTLGTTKTSTITVNVVPKTKVCSNGHTYNLRTDGSDPGCPFCRAYVANIRLINPVTPTMTITIGTTLQQNGVKLLVTYFDGHTETITGGYEDNLDTTYLGTKPVTIGYRGATIHIMVTTVCVKIACDICGFLYELYPNGINPGCPRCISKTPVFTGNILAYEEVNYTNEILEELYNKGTYYFNTNDTFSVSIKSKTSNIARTLLHTIFHNSTNNKWIYIKNSEAIKAE